MSDPNLAVDKTSIDKLWDRAGVMGLWAAAAVGIWAIIASGQDAEKQRGILQSQIDVMKAQFMPQLKFLPVGEMTAQAFNYTPVWINTGGSEAQHCRAWVNSETFDAERVPEAEYFLKPHKDIDDIAYRDVSVQDKLIASTQIYPYSTLDQVIDGKKVIIFWGKIEYSGPFSSAKAKSFCFRIEAKKIDGIPKVTLPAFYKAACNL